MVVTDFYRESVNCEVQMIFANDRESFKTVISVKIFAVCLILP